MRLLVGFLAGFANGMNLLSGDKYLNVRPMSRVIDPLKKIGANIIGRDGDRFAPISLFYSDVEPFDFESKIASAQVKSCMILAALSLDSSSFYREPELSRDHTERMLRAMGVDISNEIDGRIKISPVKSSLRPLDINIPADPSSAFFFAVAAAITKRSQVVLKNVSLNPTRVEAYKVLQKMGACIEFVELENIYEPIGNIVVKYGKLQGVKIEDNISWLIDEIPALAIACSFASSNSIVKNAKELRTKESDRISSVVENLKLCGVEVIEYDDGFEILPSKLEFAKINSFGDHRIAMSFAIAGITSGMEILDVDCIDTSFPNFTNILSKITEVK
jgi:3-phosphoshikimate 1-carboxyvinyltransferase